MFRVRVMSTVRILRDSDLLLSLSPSSFTIWRTVVSLLLLRLSAAGCVGRLAFSLFCFLVSVAWLLRRRSSGVMLAVVVRFVCWYPPCCCLVLFLFTVSGFDFAGARCFAARTRLVRAISRAYRGACVRCVDADCACPRSVC
jgi:hypothetical protein